jgi:hypothetical protein
MRDPRYPRESEHTTKFLAAIFAFASIAFCATPGRADMLTGAPVPPGLLRLQPNRQCERALPGYHLYDQLHVQAQLRRFNGDGAGQHYVYGYRYDRHRNGDGHLARDANPRCPLIAE